jgi:hypothetical protein
MRWRIFAVMSKPVCPARHTLEVANFTNPRADMNYALTILEGPTGFATLRDKDRSGPYMGAWMAYAQALGQAGVMAGGTGPQLPETATKVRPRAGSHQVEDGQFADTKEQLGGFFVIDVASMDQALDWAARAPVMEGGAVEVRPALQPPGRG